MSNYAKLKTKHRVFAGMTKNQTRHGDKKRLHTHAKELDEAVISVDVAETLETLKNNLRNWTVNLKQYVSDSFEDYFETRHVYRDRNMLPTWALCSFINTRRIYDLLEFYKGVEYTRAFLSRIYDFQAEISLFVDFALSYQGFIEDPKFTEFCDAVEDKRRQLERKALSLVDHINLIYSLMKTPKISKSNKEAQKVSLTDNEETLLFDMAAHSHQCRSRLTISKATKIKESTLKTILKAFEEKGWIDRPNGPRKGYTITAEGIQIYEIISAD